MNTSLRLAWNWLRRPAGLAGLAALLAATGCAGPTGFEDPLVTGPFYQPRNFAGDTVMPATLRRVVLLPVCAGDLAPPETAAKLDQALLVALQKQARFEVVALSRADSRIWFGAAEFSSAGALPPDYLRKIGAKFAADAVLFVDLTDYQPYRPLAVGFRAKLATITETRLVWTFDEVISTRDPGVANRARRQYFQSDPGREPVDLSPTVLQSPGRFATFAAEEMFQTLPPR